MRKTFHVCLDIAGMLAGPDRELIGLVSDENGDRLTVRQRASVSGAGR